MPLFNAFIVKKINIRFLWKSSLNISILKRLTAIKATTAAIAEAAYKG